MKHAIGVAIAGSCWLSWIHVRTPSAYVDLYSAIGIYFAVVYFLDRFSKNRHIFVRFANNSWDRLAQYIKARKAKSASNVDIIVEEPSASK